MKRTKIFSSICMLVLTIACLTFGVYSAVKTTFTASGTITFNAYGVDCLLDVTISGIQAASDTTTDSTTHLSSKTLKLSTFTKTGVTDEYTKIDTTVNMGKLVFDELNTNLTDEQRKTITISIALKNYSGFAVQLTGTVGTSLPTNLAVTLSDLVSATKSSDGTAVAATGNYTITLKANGAITEQSVNFANLTIEPYNEESFYKQYLDQGYVIETAENFDYKNGAIYKYNGTNTKIILPKIEGVYAIMGQNATSPLAAIGSQTATDIVKFSNIVSYAGKDPSGGGGISSTITDVVIPSTYTIIGNDAFKNGGASASVISSVVMLKSVITIGDAAFQSCTKLTTIALPGVTSIGQYAFASCTNLTSITMPKVTSIGSYAFQSTKLTSITIPSGVTKIDVSTFRDCDKLSSITIPNSVTGIYNSAFSMCSMLTSITFEGTKAQWNAITFGDSWNSGTGAYTIHCTDGDIAKA